MKAAVYLLITLGLVLSGCSGSRILPVRKTASPRKTKALAAKQKRTSDGKIGLDLSDYGRRILELQYHEQSWDLLLQEKMPEIEWMSHFAAVLEFDDEEDGTTYSRADRKAAREALVRYLTEQVYPISVSLQILRQKKRAMLGRYEPYLRGLQIEPSTTGLEITYKRKF